jgi:hypothetical protein
MSAAARQRLYRRREAEGRLVINLEIGAEDVDLLLAARVLDPRRDYHSREQIAAAVKEFLRLSRCA